MPEKDKELDAISTIIQILSPLDETERTRVLEYVLKRLQMGTVRTPTTSTHDASTASKVIEAKHSIKDIRTLTAEKQPRSSNEMVVLVAYYLSELAPENEHTEIVTPDLIRRYFKMAGFPLPKVLRNVLPNAASAGYLENINRGEYRLNPVGYNLVVHGLPRSSGPGPITQNKRRSTKKKAHKRS